MNFIKTLKIAYIYNIIMIIILLLMNFSNSYLEASANNISLLLFIFSLMIYILSYLKRNEDDKIFIMGNIIFFLTIIMMAVIIGV